MDYKVCILAAGAGPAMPELTNSINKAILPINFKAVISHIIEKFPTTTEMVVAVGHKKDTVMNYLALAHPERKFTFVEIDNFVGPGTGPGYSLLKCKSNLQSPFILYTADTIVLEEIPAPDHNWLGIAPVKKTEPYCTVKMKNNLIYQLDDKTKNDNKFAFIGIAGVKDYELFFQGLEETSDAMKDEIQVSSGFRKIIERSLAPVGFTWFDTGTLDNYIRTNKNFSGENKFDFSKGKGDEFLFFVGNKVIKFFADETIAKNRCERAEKYLKNLCPIIETQKGNLYSYNKVEGQVLYDVLNRQIVIDFLDWAVANLWKKINLEPATSEEYKKACESFYVTKTNKRIQSFYDKTGIKDVPITINGILVPPLSNIMQKVDWAHIKDGTPSNFHGDLQFDNILYVKNVADKKNEFVLLDWRQDFAGLVSHGDMYYDLAKLYGGTLISYQLIKDAMFTFNMSDSNVYYNYHIKNDLTEAREEFETFISKQGFDLKKIKIMTALIFLNMSPLHEEPFDKLLYFMGRSMLNRLIC